jgi:heat shock protein HslJ
MTVISCARAPAEKKANFNFADIAGKTWVLERVDGVSDTIKIDHSAPQNKDAFTISFGDKEYSGKAWPNRYRGPYTFSDGVLTMGPSAGTLMLAFGDPPGIQEHDYYNL